MTFFTYSVNRTILYFVLPSNDKSFEKRLAPLVLILFSLLAGAALLKAICISPHPPEQTYSGPIVITKGGTYTGNWESRDSEVSAIEIRTNEAVVIVNSNIRGAGPLIRSLGNSADITIRHTNGYGITPTPWRDYKKPRRFLGVDVFRNIVVENCYMENTAGIYIGQRYEGNGSTANTIKIRYNKVKNIDGRVYGGQAIAQFVQFNYRGEAPHIEIAWNEVINEPNKSAVEDNINIYNSRGTAASPILIHNNYIQGAFPFPANSDKYTGGGIITDSPNTDSTMATAYLKVYDNQLVGLGNYCLGIAGGNNIEMYRNRAIVAARFSDNTLYNCWTGGIWAKDYYKLNSTYSNKMHNNVLGIVGQTGTWRNEIMDSIFVAATTFSNTILDGDITPALEKKEYQLWLKKLKNNHIQLGPYSSKAANSVVVDRN